MHYILNNNDTILYCIYTGYLHEHVHSILNVSVFVTHSCSVSLPIGSTIVFSTYVTTPSLSTSITVLVLMGCRSHDLALTSCDYLVPYLIPGTVTNIELNAFTKCSG